MLKCQDLTQKIPKGEFPPRVRAENGKLYKHRTNDFWPLGTVNFLNRYPFFKVDWQ